MATSVTSVESKDASEVEWSRVRASQLNFVHSIVCSIYVCVRATRAYMRTCVACFHCAIVSSSVFFSVFQINRIICNCSFHRKSFSCECVCAYVYFFSNFLSGVCSLTAREWHHHDDFTQLTMSQLGLVTYTHIHK